MSVTVRMRGSRAVTGGGDGEGKGRGESQKEGKRDDTLPGVEHTSQLPVTERLSD